MVKGSSTRTEGHTEMDSGCHVASARLSGAPRVPKTASQPTGGLTQQLLDALGSAAPRPVSPLRPSTVSPSPASAKRPRSLSPGRLSRTEAEILRVHGPLSRLNALHMLDAEAAEENGGEQRGRRCKELLQIPAASLALYTRLAECGVHAADRSFATVVVRRARDAAESWAQSFATQS